MSDRLPVGDRVIMVSGASRGIGAAIARRLADDGYRLSLGARDPASLAHLGAEGRSLHHRYEATEPASAMAWMTATLARFGRLDGLVNNAGILRMVTFTVGSEEDLEELWAVNVLAPFRLTRLALPHLCQSGVGRVINIASTDGKRIRDATVSVGYAMTKHALVAMSSATRFAGWEDGVRVTALCPGAVDTGLLDGIAGVTPGPGRIDPVTLGNAVSFLLSLPNNAAVAELAMNTRLESTL